MLKSSAIAFHFLIEGTCHRFSLHRTQGCLWIDFPFVTAGPGQRLVDYFTGNRLLNRVFTVQSGERRMLNIADAVSAYVLPGLVPPDLGGTKGTGYDEVLLEGNPDG